MTGTTPRRLSFSHTPTPIVQIESLSRRLGVDLFIKRDDATGGPEAGNKVRKLEYLLADAIDRGADTILTCGAVQSNHCRATAVLSARLGLGCHVYLRTEAPLDAPPRTGNAFLMKLAGASLTLVSPSWYAARAAQLEAEAERLRASGLRPYVVPEGGSNGLGSLGYVDAMGEVRRQLDEGVAGGQPFDMIVHACGSGGTAAGIALGAAMHGVGREVRAIAVCDSTAYFSGVAARICDEARALAPALPAVAPLVVDDRFKGPGYARTSPEQRRFLIEIARTSGVMLDPVYTGKALFGLAGVVEADRSWQGKRVLFVHTGGLPGLLADAELIAGDL